MGDGGLVAVMVGLKFKNGRDFSIFRQPEKSSYENVKNSWKTACKQEPFALAYAPMKKDTPLKTAIVFAVSAAHIVGGIWLYVLSQKKPPEPPIADQLTFVDLGAPDGNGEAGRDGAPALPPAPAAPPPPPPPKKITPPPPQKKSPPPPKAVEKPVEKPQVKAVVKDNEPADLVQAKKILEPKPKKPKKTTEKTVEPTTSKAAEKTVEKTDKTAEKKTDFSHFNKKSAANASSDTHGDGDNKNANSKGSGNSHAANTSPNGKTNGGGGSNPNSSNPSNGVGSQNGKDSGKGLKGDDKKGDDKPHNPTGIADGGYITKPAPPYPAAAREREEEGTVKVEVIVSASGNVESAKVVKSSGSPRLDRAAKDAAASASYKPKSQGGVPMRTRFVAGYNFKLDD